MIEERYYSMNSRKKNKLTTTRSFCDINPLCSSRYNCYITAMYSRKKNERTTRNLCDISPFCSSGSLCLKPIVKFLFGGRMRTRKDSSVNDKCFKADVAILPTVKILHALPFQQIRLFSFHTSHHHSAGDPYHIKRVIGAHSTSRDHCISSTTEMIEGKHTKTFFLHVL